MNEGRKDKAKDKAKDGAAILALICSELEERKANELVVLPLAGKTDFADNMVVVTAGSGRHSRAMSDGVARALKDSGIYCVVEGDAGSDWLIIDSLSVVVHIFTREAREKYDLVGLWG